MDAGVLTVDGQIHTLDPMPGDILNSAAVVTPIDPEAPRGSPRPLLAVDNGVAFVSDHTTGEVHVVDLETLTVQLTFATGGIPLSLTTVAIPADEEEHDHEAHDHADHDPAAALDSILWCGLASFDYRRSGRGVSEVGQATPNTALVLRGETISSKTQFVRRISEGPRVEGAKR